MNNRPISTAVAITLLCAVICVHLNADQPSEFDEAAIRSMQEASSPSPAFISTLQAFEASNNPTIKAAKWEELVVTTSEGMLAAAWSAPAGGWKLFEFPATGNPTLEEVCKQQEDRVFYTKLIAKNETEAMLLRGVQGLLSGAALDGEEWGCKLLLDIAQRPDSNIKRLAYWSAKDFAQDWHTKGESESGAPAPVWPVDWNAWQQAYNAANALGKAIILRNVTMLGIRREQVTTAAAINLAALSGADRELKAIALASGAPALGSAVTAKWAEIAGNASDPQMQALAQEVRAKFGITD